jgi:DnaJ-class molecular chaperone
MTDPYATLGVERNADADAIRKAYRKLARRYHPDVNKDPKAEERFKEINAANEVLSDPEKRKLWDEFGEMSTRPGFDAAQARAFRAGGGPRGGGVQWDFGDFAGGDVDMEDLLGGMFGRGGFQQRMPRKGQDQQVGISIDFMTAVLGGERTITIRRPDGTTQTLKVPIPAGAKHEGKVRLKGQGMPSRSGGPAGDLIVVLEVEEHPLLRRDGDDLEMDLPVTVLEAMKGATITVPTPTGDVKVTVPPGVASGKRLRLKGRGVQKKQPGDLYLVIEVVVPKTTDAKALDAAKALDEFYEADVRERIRL